MVGKLGYDQGVVWLATMLLAVGCSFVVVVECFWELVPCATGGVLDLARELVFVWGRDVGLLVNALLAFRRVSQKSEPRILKNEESWRLLTSVVVHWCVQINILPDAWLRLLCVVVAV